MTPPSSQLSEKPLIGFIVTNFTGQWPVGTAALVYARNREHCKRVLMAELQKDGSSLKGVKQQPDDWTVEPITPIPADPVARVILDGDY